MGIAFLIFGTWYLCHRHKRKKNNRNQVDVEASRLAAQKQMEEVHRNAGAAEHKAKHQDRILKAMVGVDGD